MSHIVTANFPNQYIVRHTSSATFLGLFYRQFNLLWLGMWLGM